jgi:hypothetical protein
MKAPAQAIAIETAQLVERWRTAINFKRRTRSLERG